MQSHSQQVQLNLTLKQYEDRIAALEKEVAELKRLLTPKTAPANAIRGIADWQLAQMGIERNPNDPHFGQGQAALIPEAGR